MFCLGGPGFGGAGGGGGGVGGGLRFGLLELFSGLGVWAV